MPPKKDAKKGTTKELDPSIYVRKPVELDEIVVDNSVFEQLAGKIASIDTLFPVWDAKEIAEEKWSEPFVSEKKIKYPKNLGVTGDVNLLKFLNLEPIEVPVDPKAKKEAKKDPKKGAVEAPVQLTEVLVDEHGRNLPVVFKELPSAVEVPEDSSANDSKAHLEFEIPRPFGRAYTEEQQAKMAQLAALAEATSTTATAAEPSTEAPQPAPPAEEPAGEEVDPFLCGAFRLVQRFTGIITKAHLRSLVVVNEDVEGAEKSIEDSRHVLESTFLWRAIYPQLPSGKPVYNPAGKYCVRLFLAGQWRRVFVDDSVPVTADGRPAVACSQDHLELWPLLLAKALYAVYSACGYVDVVADVQDYAEDRTAAVQSEASAAAAEGTVGETAMEAGAEAAAPAHIGPYPLTALPRAQCIAHFTSFVLHVLTGWQPRAPTSMRKMFGEEHTRALKLLEALAVEGVSTIDEDDVVRDRNEETATERAQAARRIEEFDSTVLQDSVSFEDGLRDLAEASEEDSLAHSLVQNDPLPGSRRSGEADDFEDDEDLDFGSVDEAGSYKRAPGRVERGAEIVEAPDDGIVRRTKQQFKTEYMRRKEHRDAVTATILERERRIAKVTQQLEALLTEAFFLTFLDPASQQVRILPVLGVSYPELYKSSLWEVQLLVHWRPGTPQETEFTANPTPEDTESAEIRGVNEGPLPRTTPLEYEWLTIRELMELDAVLLGMDTGILTPFDAVFRNPWVPLSSLPTPGAPPAGAVTDKAPAAAKDKAKGKDKNAPAEAPVVEEYFADPGVLPVTLLRLNTPEFFTEELAKSSKRPPLARQSSTISVSGKHTAVKSEVRRAMRKGALEETEAALREEQYEADLEEDSPEAALEAPLKSGASSGLQPVADFLHFTVMIHADAVLEYKEAVPIEAAPQDGSDLTEGKAKPRHMLPSDVTLVLQEVRTDKVDPLMFVMEMKAASYLPLLSKSFAISTKRFRANPGQPLVFWMRLFSKASVYMHFSSEVGVSVGPAEQIWAGIGKSVFLKEGRAEATRQQTQQLVFRLPLVCDQPAATSADAAASESKGEGEGEAAPSPAPKAVATGMTFLQVTDRGIDRFISLGLLPADRTEPLVPLPRTQGNIVQFASELSEATILLGRTFPAALFDKRASSVPAFSWRLLILSDDPIREPAKPINEEIVSQRFVGKFIANNKNALFRDIYTIDKLSFPLAFRLTTAHNRPATGSTQDRELAEKTERSAFAGMSSESARKALKKALTVKGRRKDLCLSVKLYRASDMKLVSEFKGRESVICYFQSLDSFLPDGETFDVAGALAAAAAAGGAGKKDAKTPAKAAGKGAAPAVTLDTVDVLVECTLDEEAMLISDEWQSRYPHVFDCLYPDSSAAGVRAAQEAAAEKEKAAGGKKGEAVVDPDEAIRKNAEVIQAQQQCLAIAPPSKTLIKWQLDVLAGKVNSISHDTSALEKELAVKNSWEDSSAGRAERSAAALKYYQERRAAMQKLLEDAAADSRPATASSIQEGVAEEKASQPAIRAASSRPGTGHHAAATATAEGAAAPSAGFTALAPSMAEALTTALGGDADQLNRRYTVLTNMPTQFVKVDVLQTEAEDPHVSFIQPRDKTNAQSERDLLTQLQVQRTSESQRSEARHQDVAERFVRLNAECRQEAKERVEAIVKEANADAVALAALWEAREKYRLFVEAQNASLVHLLKRAADAKVVARAAEKKAADEAAALAEKLRKEEEKKAAKKK